MNEEYKDLFEYIEDDEDRQIQDIIERILKGPEIDSELIIIACMSAIHAIVVQKNNAMKYIQQVADELISGIENSIKDGMHEKVRNERKQTGLPEA